MLRPNTAQTSKFRSIWWKYREDYILDSTLVDYKEEVGLEDIIELNALQLTS